MPTNALVPTDQRERLLADAVRRRCRVTLSRRGARGWEDLVGTFFRLEGGQLVVQLGGAGNEAKALPAVGDTVGVHFRLGHKKCIFNGTILAVERRSFGFAVRMAQPDQLRQLQRRVFERVAPPDGVVIAVRFWRLEAPEHAPGAQRDVRHGQLEDVSAGGLRIKVAELKGDAVGQLYQCVFSARQGAPAFMIEAVLRHIEATDQGRVSLGFHFVGLESQLEGQQTLERLAKAVSHFQRLRLHQGHGRT